MFPTLHCGIDNRIHLQADLLLHQGTTEDPISTLAY